MSLHDTSENVSICYTIAHSIERGTHILAKPFHSQCLEKGVTLWLESPFASVVLEENRDRVCHNCWKPQGGHASIVCSNCEWAVYCSDTCLKLHSNQHQPLCLVFTTVAQTIADRTGVTVTRVRLLMACAQNKANAANDQSNLTNQNMIRKATYDETIAMSCHRHDPEGNDCFLLAARAILAVIPKQYSLTMTPEELAHFACLSDTNSFGITMPTHESWKHCFLNFPVSNRLNQTESNLSERPKIISLFVSGLGLFPQCAKLNHSCFPSCNVSLSTFSESNQDMETGPILRIRTIRPVLIGEELTDSYVDLYTDRKTRQEQLLKTKHFFCQCSRCKTPLNNSLDRFLEGYVCPICVPKPVSSTECCYLIKCPTWNVILQTIGEFILSSEQIQFPAVLQEVVKYVLEDLPQLCNLWTTDKPCVVPDIQIKEYMDLYSPIIQRSLYEPSIIPVVIRPDANTQQKSSNSLECHSYSDPYQCEVCSHEITVDMRITQEQKTTLLWNRLVTSFGSTKNAFSLRRQIALFLKLFGGSTLHPYHVWVYRASQQLVDSSSSVLYYNAIHTDDHGEHPINYSKPCERSIRFMLNTLLIDLIALRHQLACQIMALPLCHEETFLTFRVLLYILVQLYEKVYNEENVQLVSDTYLSRSMLQTAICSSEKGSPNKTMGEDTTGKEYASIKELWDDESSTPKSKDEWYRKSLDYWAKSTASINGVLAGYEVVSPIDLEASAKFLQSVKSLPSAKGGSCEFNTALDCGAGVGRVTDGLLSKHFVMTDVLEPVPHLLEKAKETLNGRPEIGMYYCDSLQGFVPEKNRYDCIWLQWCVLYLTDSDLIECLRRFKQNLKPNGVLCVKENVVLTANSFHLDREDNSLIRTDSHYRRLFKDAGLITILEMRQPKFPKSLFPVMMYCLR